MTMVTGSIMRSDRVASELVAERGQHPLPERIVVAGSEAREQRRRQRRERHRAIETFLQRPSPLPGVLDVRLEMRELGILRERARGELEQPRSDDAALEPERRNS